jgi:hypothetical protein
MKKNMYFDKNFGTRRKRKIALKTVIARLDDIRNAESRALANTPANFQNSVRFEEGEIAVDTLDEAISALADVY